MISGVKIRSLVSVVPKRKLGIEDLVARFGGDNAEKITSTTGVKYRHISEDKKTLDLALEAGKYALEKAGVHSNEIDGIILVTQTPEYRLPSTACILQHMLGIKKTSFALDIGLGCSGFPYGVITAASLIKSGTVSRMLLISGDLTSMNASPEDKSTYPLFADGFGAIILEGCEDDGDILGYDYGTDGSGWSNMVIHAGMAKYPKIEDYYKAGADKRYPEVKFPEYAYMDGGQIFTFCLREVPSMIDRSLAMASKSKEDIDLFLFHQANLFILKHIGKKMKIPETKIPICLDRYGNTGSSSIVLAACDHLGGKFNDKHITAAMIAFGVG